MYISTRGNYAKIRSAEAIRLGMVPEGGLFVPEAVPALDRAEINRMAGQSYQQIAQTILKIFLDDFTSEEIDDVVSKSYQINNFDHPDIAPLVQIDSRTFILELWHGPTGAFKDMALQIMPRLLSHAVQKTGAGQEIIIPVATSGDTGKAALEGFRDVPGVKIIVFFPFGGVSRVQELQMITAAGNNVHVVAVKGNFDDCQTAVKELFADSRLNQVLAEHNMAFSSANSINWGRLVPQIIYYFWAYAQMQKKGEILPGEKINVVVPTGNFGNILAGFYAHLMGLPVHKFICASNENKVLTDVIRTGIYDRRREFFKTNSPSMDILISSNFERFLFEVNGHDGDKITKWFHQLHQEGYFQVDDHTKEKWQSLFISDYATGKETLAQIKETFEKTGYLLDPHTAVGLNVYEKYYRKTGDNTKTVIDATANPYKFNHAVWEALAGSRHGQDKDEFLILDELHRMTGFPIHRALKDLNKRMILHDTIVEKEELKETVKRILAL
ncbi:threonine synthase [Candidatus Formimonas warabiya]|uniref:Threonine synthase n=1 Tax=Formimonas warabiya TaxID=1761012 RepID=A0A3G1KMI2_FORW1|nr:threonine synthase [Candidatus Formimonas warabiya]ATW23668.1 threonine synthase [Candidatus Formimonas warabiya]